MAEIKAYFEHAIKNEASDLHLVAGEKPMVRIQGQLKESGKIVREVTEKLTKLEETNKQVVSFAEQLQSLEDVLKNPKQRGILGEYYLEELLEIMKKAERYPKRTSRRVC